MTAIEPELITIIEGPTPEFRPTPVDWVQSVLEGPADRLVAVCHLRTNNGPDIMERCRNAWKDNRPVRLDFPDEMRMRQQVDVVSIRLDDLEEGPALMLWVALPLEVIEEMEETDESDEDDDFFFP